MPRKRKITEIEDIIPSAAEQAAAMPGGDLTPEPEPEPPTPDEQDLHLFLNGFGMTSGKVRVYRYDASGNKTFLGSAQPDVVSEEWIQEQYGAGKYQVRLLDSKGIYVTSTTVHIGAANPNVISIKEPVPALGMNSAPDIVTLQLEMMRAELAASREMMIKVIEKIGNSEPREASTFGEVASAMAALKEVVRPPDPQTPMSMVAELIGVFKQGLEIGQSGGVPVSKTEGWMGIAKDVLGAIPALVSMRGAAPAPEPVPGRITQAPPAQALQNPLGIPPELFNAILGGLGYLKTRCQHQKDPNLYVEMICDNLDQGPYMAIAQLATEKTLDDIAKLTDPEIAVEPYRAWFQTVLDGVKDVIRQNSAVNGTEGNEPDDSDDGATGAGIAG